jgi:hypothetical protein
MESTELETAEIIQLCQSAMAMENSALQAYRNIFLAIETLALTVATILVQFGGPSTSVLAIIASGLILVPIWIMSVHGQCSVVDEWKMRIYNNSRNDKVLSEYYKWYNLTGLHTRHSVRLWLDICVPLCYLSASCLWLVLYLHRLRP